MLAVSELMHALKMIPKSATMPFVIVYRPIHLYQVTRKLDGLCRKVGGSL
jgi:hypothetical protein